MAMKPNYHQQRGDRARTKEQKKREKLTRRQEQSDQRKADDPATASDTGDGNAENTVDVDIPSAISKA